MTDFHAEIRKIYARINTMWAGASRPISDDDVSQGKTAEVLRWCRDRLGGHDRDLVPPGRWEKACRGGWSIQVTYACLPQPLKGWQQYIHDAAHFIHQGLNNNRGHISYENHDLEQARIELELTELVLGWFADEARGVERSFKPLKLSRPSNSA
jgi:hypothetical protein